MVVIKEAEFFHKRRRGRQKMSWLDSITDLMDMNLSKVQEIERTGKPGMLQSME